ncbi:MAG: hypothetical protein LBR26_02785, partial [Prevotella sp.]|nr:hypothetical protein [Prevotella sp.]
HKGHKAFHKGHKEFHLQILQILCVKNFGAQKPHFYHISSMHNSIQIVALQENSFNTKGAKCITKDTKNFLCRFCGFFALKILEHKTSFLPYIVHAQNHARHGIYFIFNDVMRLGVRGNSLVTEVVLFIGIR